MKKLKASLVAIVLFLSVGVTFATKESSNEQSVYCSEYPNSFGWIMSTTEAGCKWPQAQICCYRVPDNLILYKP